MADVRRAGSVGTPAPAPDEIAGRTFAISRRGFDTNEVRAFLAQVAAAIRDAAEREAELRRAVAEAEERAAHPPLDEAVLTNVLGEETARILHSAREAAADTKAKAEENVALLLREAHDQAGRIRAEAELVLAREVEEAERQAARITGAAEADASAVLGRARQEAEGLLEDVQLEARAMVEEAQAKRARILGDLSRRRRLAHTQVEQLRAGRERLLEAYRLVRSTLDDVTEELTKAEFEARQAAEAAARRLAGETLPDDDAIEPESAIDEGDDDVGVREEPAADLDAADPDAADPEAAGEAPADAAAEAVPGAAGGEPALITTTPIPPARPPATARIPASEGSDERKLSSLRILRPRRGAAEASPAAVPSTESEDELDVVEPPSADEHVRVIGTPSATGTEDAPDAGAGAAPEAAGAPPTTEPPLPEDEGGAEVFTAAEEALPEETASPSPPAEEAAGDQAPADEHAEPSSPPVEDIFARIRAERAEAVARARAVLAETTEAAGDTPATTATAESPAAGEAADPAHSGEPVAAPIDEPITDPDESALQQRDHVLEPIQARLAKRLKRALQDEQNDVLDTLRLQKGRADPDAILPSEEAQRVRYRDAGVELLEESAQAGVRFGAADAPIPVHIDDLADALADTMAAPLRRRLQRGLEEGALEDASLLVQRIGAAYREVKAQRVERTAGDHLLAAFSRGVLAAVGDGVAMRWIVDDEDGPCPDCDDNALAAGTLSGAMYPTGQPHPPAHGGCRCLLVRAST